MCFTWNATVHSRTLRNNEKRFKSMKTQTGAARAPEKHFKKPLDNLRGGEIYTVFVEEADLQVKNSQFRRPGSKNMERKNKVVNTFLF